MNIRYLTLDEDSPAVLKGVLWALAMAATLVVFVLLLWLGVQRVEVFEYRRSYLTAEQERNAAYAEKNAAIQSCNERLAREESARYVAENKMRLAIQAQNNEQAQRDQDEREITALRNALSRSRY